MLAVNIGFLFWRNFGYEKRAIVSFFTLALFVLNLILDGQLLIRLSELKELLVS